MGGSRRLVFAPMLRVYTLWKGMTYQEGPARETHSGQTPQWRETGDAMTVASLWCLDRKQDEHRERELSDPELAAWHLLRDR